MLMRIKWSLFLILITASAISFNLEAGESDSVKLFTPYRKVTVSPGESLEFTITVVNDSRDIKTMDVSVAGVPKGWNYTLKSGTWNLKKISVMPKERQTITFKVDVPFNVNKGTYQFNIVASNFDTLPIEVIVTKQGSFNSEFTVDQNNLQGTPTSSFTFNAKLRNRTPERQLYAFTSYAPRGWSVTFKVNYQAVTSAYVEPNTDQTLTIDVKPPERAEAGKYKIPVAASTGSNTVNLELEIVITGTYGIDISTPTGLLSTKMTAGEEKKIDLIVKNTGTAELSGMNLNYSGPVNWSCDFEPKRIDRLAANDTAKVVAKLKADKKAIPGDYVVNFDISTPEAASKVTYRVTIETPLLWGWVGIAIIVAAIGCVYYLFRKYGRR